MQGVPVDQGSLSAEQTGGLNPLTFAQLWEQAVREFPHRSAIQSETETLSYSEANERANRLARLLLTHGAGPNRLIALALPRSSSMVVSALAVAKTGAAFLPVDDAYPAERISYILQDAAPTLLCNVGAGAPMPASATRPPTLRLDDAEQVRVLKELSGEDLRDEERGGPLSATDLAYVIYTSGSTGRPKGVAVTHTGLSGLASAKVAAMKVDTGSRVLQFASPSFDAFLTEILVAFTAGATLFVPPPGTLAGDRLRTTLRSNRISHAVLPPAAAATISPHDFPDLRTLVVAGEACPEGLVRDWAPSHRLINAYGPTEATVCATMTEPLSSDEAVTIGRPIPGLSVHILDDELRPVRDGETGDLYIDGVGLARGYLGRPFLTAERFVANPFSGPGTRMYRTGDLASRREDGRIQFHGRSDHQVKLRGFRIELGEVEAVLERHPKVGRAVVLRTDRAAAAPLLAAYFVPSDSDSDAPSPTELREHAMRFLPDFMVPSVYTTLASLPLSPNGKIDRAALPEPTPEGTATGRKPQEAAEKVLCEILGELLGTSEIDADTDFFAMGGNSLMAIDFIQRAGEAGLDISPRTVMKNPTIAALAAAATRGEHQ